MGIRTHTANPDGGEERDSGDFERLRHARERNLGFPVGRYIQPPPMLFTRDGHNIFLGDMYRGHSAFLICAGPSLATHDLSKLNQRGILTCAVNNAATLVRPQTWVSVDDPGNFSDVIWHDPGILKFIPLCHMEKFFTERDEHGQLIKSSLRVGDMPGTFGYRRNEAFEAAQWLYEDTFNWGNHSKRLDSLGNRGSRSVMYIALRLLFYLGVRQLFLLGCDFRMNYGKRNYAFEQDRSLSSVRGNNDSYRVLNERLSQLQPYFENEGFKVFNCTKNSGLTVFPYLSYESALHMATQHMPLEIITSGMYDRVAQENKDRSKKHDSGTNLSSCQVLDRSATSELATNATIQPTTLITWVTRETLPLLQFTWQTWMRFKPWLNEIPKIVLHDDQLSHQLPELLQLSRDHNIRFLAHNLHGDMVKERLAKAMVLIPAQDVTTPWCFWLDPTAIATDKGPGIAPHWFVADENGREPVYVAHTWGYSKPANVIDDLNTWGDGIAGLSHLPRPNFTFEVKRDRLKHPTISSWCFFCRTEWTQDIVSYLDKSPPCSDHNTLMFYLAARRGELGIRVNMKQCGWEHSFGKTEFIPRRCLELLE